VPPVHSPLSAGAIAAGIRAAVRGDDGAAGRVARSLEAFHGSGRALLTNSGTTALTLAMRWTMAASRRSTIALPAYCCYDLVTALQGAGAEAIFYDIDPATLGPDWDSLAHALTQRPAAVVVAHLYGLPVDMIRVLELTEGTGVTVIEDAAQGSGATLHRRPVGSFGQLAVLSFGRGKGVTAGRGGALLVNAGWRGGVDESVLRSGGGGGAELLPLLAQWILARPSLYRIPASLPFLGLGETVYRRPGPLRRISAVAAAVLDVSWRERESEITARRRNAESLRERIRDVEGCIQIAPIAGASPGWLRFPVVLQAKGRPVAAATGLVRSYPRVLPEVEQGHPGARQAGTTPGASRLADSLLTLATHGLVVPGDLTRARRAVGAMTAQSGQPD